MNEFEAKAETVKSELEMQKYALDQAAIVAVTDNAGTITYVNEKFCTISKYSKEELIGQNHRILKSGFHSDEFYIDLWNTIRSGKSWRGQIKNKAKDGTYYWVYTTIIPFLDQEKKPFKYLSIRFDITEQKNLEESLEQMVRERTSHLEEANIRIEKMMQELSSQNKQLNNFCNIVSHDLRAPLGNLIMLVELIEYSDTLEDQTMLISQLKPVVNSLHQTFSELTEAILVKQDEELASEKINLEKCMNDVLEGFKGEVNKYSVNMDVDFKDAPVVFYPSRYMVSIFSNLISNAIKYQSDNRQLEIRIRTMKQGDKIILSVSDNGLGIDMAKNRDQLFKIGKKFHHHPEAKGIGLFLLKSQVESKGGSIWLESEVDKGSTFFIEFINQ